MGARQSKRSVDITTTPKKGDGDVAVGEEKIEKLGDADVKAVVTNGAATHTDIEFADKDEETRESEEKPSTEVKENGVPESSEGEKTPDKEAVEAAGDQPPKSSEEVIAVENSEKVAETPDSKKQKEKKKKKWSLRSISFSKKDKSKPGKEKEKNGEVEEINEENTEQNATTPTAEPLKADESKTPVEENSETPVTNGDASKEELDVKVPEVESAEVETEKAKTQEESASNKETADNSKDEPKADEPVPQAKVEEGEKPAGDEPKLTSDEIPVVPPPTEEVKEVRSEEIPPPLPSSNPPSQVTVFAESTKANVLSVDEISVSEKPELPVDVSVCSSEHSCPHPKVSESPKVESVSIEQTSESHVESIQSNVESSIDIACPLPLKADNLPESQVLSSVGDVSAATIVAASPKVECSEINEAISAEQNKNIVEPVLIIESSPLMVVNLPKESGETLNEICSEISGSILEGGDSSLDRNESETTNLTESKDSNDIESGQISLKVEDEDNAVSIPSLPMLIDEKMPVVSSEGDMLNPLDSQSSLQSDGSELQELISNINLKDSPTSQENSLISEQQSDILSTIPEADSKELRLEEDNSSVNAKQVLASGDLASTDLSTESSQKDMEPVCNADSLPDLSTESLPSLPEPTDSIIEPMSLPPLDSVPDPLVDDNIPTSPSTKLDSSPIPQETAPVVLTNGNATNGLKASPTADDDETPTLPPLDGPLKQVVAPEPIVEEKSQTAGDAPVESVESTPAAAE